MLKEEAERLRATVALDWKRAQCINVETGPLTVSRLIDDLNTVVAGSRDAVLDGPGLYMLVLCVGPIFVPLYIGRTESNGQVLRDRIPHETGDKAYEKVVVELKRFDSSATVGLYFSSCANNTLDRTTDELLADTECCLIWQTKPVGNSICKDTYNSSQRRSITIINDGNKGPLANCYRCP